MSSAKSRPSCLGLNVLICFCVLLLDPNTIAMTGFIATGVIKIPWHFPDIIHISLTKRNNKSVDEGSKEHISK